VKRLLLRESQEQPLLLVFEDLHWIDTETQALLNSLVESVPTARLLLLVNYRPEYQHGWGSKTYYTQLRLDPLPPASAEEFLHALLGDDPSLTPLTRLLIERTEGNPFFLEESMRTLVETGVLVGAPGAYRLAQALLTIQVPATVQAVLAARIDRLPPEEKRLLQTTAVLGTEVPLPLLQAIAELPEEALHRALLHLHAAEFLSHGLPPAGRGAPRTGSVLEGRWQQRPDLRERASVPELESDRSGGVCRRKRQGSRNTPHCRSR
jgi:predicted ATPase